MISKDVFTGEYIKGIKAQKDYEKVNPSNLERMIYAFSLLEALKIEGLDFIFKGGTSLALLFKKPRRFSVDIDILSADRREKIENALKNITGKTKFKKWGIYEKRSYQPGSIPKAHYYLLYDSLIENRENIILLDILFGENFYPKTQEVELKNAFLVNEGEPVVVEIPTINSIVGDKLTAFAPNTSGYEYRKNEPALQNIKQLFDLSFLFDEISDYHEVFDSFNSKLKVLNSYPNKSFTSDMILDDIFNTCLILSNGGKRLPAEEKYKYENLESGIRSLSDFLIQRPFHLQIAVEASSKIALLAARIKKGYAEVIDGFNSEGGLKMYIIDIQEYSYLNKLRKQAAYSLYYWHNAINIMQK